MGRGAWTVDQSQRTAPYLEAYPGYVVSLDGACGAYRDREAARENVPNRTFHALTPEQLVPGQLEDLWYMGIIVCPGEDVLPIAKRVATLGQEIGRERIHLYLAPGVDELSVISRWKQAGIGPPAETYPFAHEEDPWLSLHKQFGNRHAAQVDHDLRAFPNHMQQYRAKGSP